MLDKKEVAKALLAEVQEQLALIKAEARILGKTPSPDEIKWADELERRWSEKWLKLRAYAETQYAHPTANVKIEEGAVARIRISYHERKIQSEEFWFIYPNDFPGRGSPYHKFRVGDKQVYLQTGYLHGKRSLLGAEAGTILKFPADDEIFFEACEVGILEIA